MGSAQRVREHRERLRDKGLRPIQIWVPDTKTKGFAEEVKRQCKLVAKHEDEELMNFIDAQWDELEPYE